MKKDTKSVIKRSLLSGIIFALSMEVFHLVNTELLNIWRFIFQFLFFGGANGALRYYDLKRQKESKTKRKLNRNNAETNNPDSN